MAGIARVAYRLPAERLSLTGLARAGRLQSSAAMLRELGFRHGYAHSDPATFSSLVIDAGREVLDGSGLDPADIGTVLVYSGLGEWWNADRPSDGPLDLFRYPVARVAHQLGLSHANVLGLSQQGCTGLLSAINLAAALVEQPHAGAVLCLSGDVLPIGSRREVMYNLMSDAAGAALVVAGDGPNRILQYHQLAETGYWDTPSHENELIAAYFPMARLSIQEALARAGLAVSEVAWFVPSNVNERSWRVLADLLQIPIGRAFTDNIGRVGHSVSCDHLINLVDMQSQGLVKPGDLMLWSTFGFGASWSTLLVRH